MPPSWSVRRRSAPTLLFLPDTISVVLTAGCQAPRSLKLLTFVQTVAAEALMVTSSCAERLLAYSAEALNAVLTNNEASNKLYFI